MEMEELLGMVTELLVLEIQVQVQVVLPDRIDSPSTPTPSLRPSTPDLSLKYQPRGKLSKNSLWAIEQTTKMKVHPAGILEPLSVPLLTAVQEQTHLVDILLLLSLLRTVRRRILLDRVELLNLWVRRLRRREGRE